MDTASDTSELHARDLAELTALGMALARDLQAAALAAEEAEEKAGLAAAFHRVARTVRQSMALQARLAREARREVIEIEREAAAVRKAQVRARVRNMVWNEAEPCDCPALLDDLDDRLSDAEHRPGFAGEALDAAVARLRGELGLEPGVAAAPRRARAAAPRFPSLEVRFVDPTPGADLSADHFHWRSSA